MIVVELIFLSLVGVLLTNMQTSLSLDDQRDNIAEKARGDGRTCRRRGRLRRGDHRGV